MKVRARRRYRMTARSAAAAATAERIIAAATELFLDRPYEAVALDDVARAAGVTVQTVLRRFGSKEQLVAAAAEAGLAQVRAERDQAPVGDRAGAVRDLGAHYEAWGDRVLRLLAQEERVAPLRRITDAGRLLHRRWIARTFAPWLRGRAARRLPLLVAVTDVLVWKLLRRDQGLGRAATERALLELVRLVTGG
jgi:AcrR family transcriptional regulator